MLYLIGLGLNEKSLSKEALEIISKSDKVYLEKYTVDFPYDTIELEKIIKKKIKELGREDVESDFLIKESKKQDICLLIYGSPLFATTHNTLIKDCMDNKIKYKILFNASVFDAISETGLELYKFGKISSMPKWLKNFEPDSFLDYVIENQKIDAHSLILIDIGLDFKEALNQLSISSNKKGIRLDKLIVCSLLGTDRKKIYYGNLDKLKSKKIKSPFCFIIPSRLHFVEKEFLMDF